jgi:flagellar P-ring protein precursor FlgI
MNPALRLLRLSRRLANAPAVVAARLRRPRPGVRAAWRAGCAALALLAGCVPAAHAERIKDLVSIQGVRDNPLIGYGLVVGLDGTGDQTTQTPFTTQALTNMLSNLGVSVGGQAANNMQLKNVAAVMVTATLPPFVRPGEAIDVTVSSLGNAQSLRGGTLLMTPL